MKGINKVGLYTISDPFEDMYEMNALADKLNAGIDPEAEEEAETETIEDTGAPLEPYIDDDEEGDEP